jgi:toxin-antitoxin system PIN domain toxin
VIAIDTNLLVYAHRRDSEWHEQASTVVRDLAEGSAAWAVPWPCLHEFLTIVTHPSIFMPPSPLEAALDQVDAWFESPTLLVLTESADHWTTLRVQLIAGQVTGPRIHDARVAAMCVAHGVTELWSADRDFSRFPELELRNPLIVKE